MIRLLIFVFIIFFMKAETENTHTHTDLRFDRHYKHNGLCVLVFCISTQYFSGYIYMGITFIRENNINSY